MTFEVEKMRVRVNDRRANRLVSSTGYSEVKDLTDGSTRWSGDTGDPTSWSDGVYEKVWDQTHGRPPYEDGGPFFLYRTFIPSSLSGTSVVRGIVRTGPSGPPAYVPPGHQYYTRHSGRFWVSDVLGSVPGMNISSPNDHYQYTNPDDLQSVGNRAWSKLRPKVEIGTLFQDIYELKDVPGMLHTTAKGFHDIWKSLGGGSSGSLRFLKENYKMFPKKVGDHYLNVQFGWKPFIQSINNVCDVVVNFHDHVSRLEKQNDRWMQRKFSEPVNSVSDVYSDYWDSTNGCNPSMNNNTFVQPWTGHHVTTREKITKVWYSGSFKFYRPEFDKGLESGYPTIRGAQQMLTLLGAEINPVNLYKVMPWTWLVDWFANVGDGVQRFQDMATGQVAARYFYLMREDSDVFRYTTSWTDYWGDTHSHSWVKGVQTKLRVGSQDPFNFALVPGGLSRGQLQILAALGLSRLP